jgi:hypothetical protein
MPFKYIVSIENYVMTLKVLFSRRMVIMTQPSSEVFSCLIITIHRIHSYGRLKISIKILWPSFIVIMFQE